MRHPGFHYNPRVIRAQSLTVGDGQALTALNWNTYTPTLTNTTNLSASTAYVCHWKRVGTVVTVAGRFDADPTAAGAVLMGMSLPVASDLASDTDLAGVATCDNGSSIETCLIRADATNNRASIIWYAGDTANQARQFIFQYIVK